jgi:hypothetical protein
MSQTKTYKVQINSIDVTSYVSIAEIVRTFTNNITNAKIVLKRAVSNVLVLDENNINYSVIIQRGNSVATEETVFRGSIYNFSKDGFDYVLECKNKLFELVRKLNLDDRVFTFGNTGDLMRLSFYETFYNSLPAAVENDIDFFNHENGYEYFSFVIDLEDLVSEIEEI